MRTWTLTAEPTGEAYADLLEAAVDYASEIRFVTFDRWSLHGDAERLISALEPWLVGSYETEEWPGTRMTGGWLGRVHSYRYDRESVAMVLNQTSRLWQWGGNLPNDLHLVRADGTAWFASITSEDDVWLTLTDEEHKVVIQRPALAALLPSVADQ